MFEGKFVSGDLVTLSCEAGYTIAADVEIKLLCSLSGLWEPDVNRNKQEYSCTKMQCQPPPTPNVMKYFSFSNFAQYNVLGFDFCKHKRNIPSE